MLFVLDAREPADFDRWQRDERARQGLTPPDAAILVGEGPRAE
jgi:hypothetical protein